ncbi:MAG: sterol desaturase family protein [Pseudomonadota bacterium]
MLEQLGLPLTFAGFIMLWGATYGALLLLYFLPGLLMEWLGRRHPERRIQKRSSTGKARDIRQSVLSLATIAIYVAGGLFAQATGWTVFGTWEASWWSIPLGIALSAIAYDTWFYWFHRLMHTRAFWRFHAQHHQAIAPSTWSCNNDTLVGCFFEQAYFLFVAILLPIPSIVLVAHKVFDQVTGMISHAGYEFFASPSARSPWPGLCTTFHDQHHSHFRVNYGNTFSLWDRWMGTLHPDYDNRVEAFERMAEATPTTERRA